MTQETLTAEIIEKEIDRQEQNETEDFDNWFQEFVESDEKLEKPKPEIKLAADNDIKVEYENSKESEENTVISDESIDAKTVEVENKEDNAKSIDTEINGSTETNKDVETVEDNDTETNNENEDTETNTENIEDNNTETNNNIDNDEKNNTENVYITETPDVYATEEQNNENEAHTEEETKGEFLETFNIARTENYIKNNYVKTDNIDDDLNKTIPETTTTEKNTYIEAKPISISEVQPKEKKKENVEIKHHHKHRSRKTEISTSKPTKKEQVIKEDETCKIEVGTEKAKNISDAELEQNIKDAKNRLTNDISKQVEEMELNGNCKKLDIINYTPGASDKYSWFKSYILNELYVPYKCFTRFSLNEYINKTTYFRYNCFDSPNESMLHPIPEKVIFTEKLNKLFNWKFTNSQTGDFHFADLDKQILEYLSQFKDEGSLHIEYIIVQRFLGKLMLALNTDVEMALRDNTKPTLDTKFKQAIIYDIQAMKYIQSQNGKLYVSWKTFLDTLLGLGPDKLIYVHDNYRNLNKKLEKAYKTDFLIETLVGNTLKCYLPSVAINYFFAVKSCYIIARLVSLYVSHKMHANKSLEEVVNDLYIISSAGIMTYENKNFIYKQASRSLPTYDKPISKETQMYILNHLLTGGQYYILKMFEESLPSLASDILKA